MKSDRPELFRYIFGILRNKRCHPYRINGVEDHIHILTHLHPSVSLSGLVKDIKLASNEHIKTTDIFNNFHGWQSGYGAFTYSIKEKERLVTYIKNQEEHHRRITFWDEFIELLREHDIKFDERYLL